MTSNKQSENIIEGRPQRGSNAFRMPLKEGERKLGWGWKYEGNDKEEKGDLGNWRAERGMKEATTGRNCFSACVEYKVELRIN